MLIKHRIDDVNERLVAGKQAVAPGEQISLEPAFAHVFAEHLHDAAVNAEIGVISLDVGHPFLTGDLINGLQAVRSGFVGPKQPEILLVEIELHDVAQKCSKYPRCLRLNLAGLGHRDGIVVKVRHRQRLQQFAAVGMRV